MILDDALGVPAPHVREQARSALREAIEDTALKVHERAPLAAAWRGLDATPARAQLFERGASIAV